LGSATAGLFSQQWKQQRSTNQSCHVLLLEKVLFWLRGNGSGHINKVKLRRARLVLGLVTIYGRSTIQVFIQVTQAHSAWPSHRRWVQWKLAMVSASAGKEMTTSA